MKKIHAFLLLASLSLNQGVAASENVTLLCRGSDSDDDKIEIYIQFGSFVVGLRDAHGDLFRVFSSQAIDYDYTSSAHIGKAEVTFSRRSRSPYKGRFSVTEGSVDRKTGLFDYLDRDYDGVEYRMSGQCVSSQLKKVERKF